MRGKRRGMAVGVSMSDGPPPIRGPEGSSKEDSRIWGEWARTGRRMAAEGRGWLRRALQPAPEMESCLEVGLSALAQPRLTKGGQPYPRLSLCRAQPPTADTCHG